MSNSYKSELPIFFNYEEEGKVDAGYENNQDFFLSWTLRCAANKYKNVNPKLQEYSRNIAFALIYGENIEGNFKLTKKTRDDFRIIEISTKRQFKWIDLVAILKVEENGILKKYIFNIENKWYTRIKEGQLEKSKSAIRSAFDINEYEIKDFVIFCDNEIICKEESQRQLCYKNGYKHLSICDLYELANMQQIGPTNNALFDEYWFIF